MTAESRSSPTQTQGSIPCPQCKHRMPMDAMTCPNCGVDLALIALLSERLYLDGLPGQGPAVATPEALIPRIGEDLLQQGVITSDQLQQALQRQKQLSARGEQRLLGQTLVEMGFVDSQTLDQTVNRQIIALHAALQDSNRNLERRVAEQTSELRKALERLTEVTQLKANLISNVSHELRTPLAHIKGYIELIAEGQLGPVSPEQANAMEVVRRGSVRLEQLIEDLIEFSTASRQGLTIRPGSVDLTELAQDVFQRSASKAGKAGVSLANDVAPGLPSVRADPERLGWVIFQLLDNGIKFTPEGGTVTLHAAAIGKRVTAAVEDTGIGIPGDKIDEIFVPFHQLDSSSTRRYGGTGLGLALVKLILEAHGSRLEVHSEVGAGSIFSFSLPLAG